MPLQRAALMIGFGRESSNVLAPVHAVPPSVAGQPPAGRPRRAAPSHPPGSKGTAGAGTTNAEPAVHTDPARAALEPRYGASQAGATRSPSSVRGCSAPRPLPNHADAGQSWYGHHRLNSCLRPRRRSSSRPSTAAG